MKLSKEQTSKKMFYIQNLEQLKSIANRCVKHRYLNRYFIELTIFSSQKHISLSICLTTKPEPSFRKLISQREKV